MNRRAKKVDKKTEQSRSHYNQLAQTYDSSAEGRYTLPFNQYVCDHLPLADKDAVLDVACGNGRLLRMLSRKACITACGIDVSEEMIAAAQNLYQEASFHISPAETLCFSDDSFDYVTTCCAFHHFKSPDAFLREAYRVLKRNGKLVIADPSPAVVVRWLENLIIPCMNTGDIRIYSAKELYLFFHKAGFESISHEKRNGMVLIQGTKK